MTFETLKSCEELEGAHLEVAKGKPEDNERYCTKPGAVGGPYRSGTLAGCTFSGLRTDLVKVRETLKKGSSFKDLVEDDTTVVVAARHTRFVEKVEKLYTVAPARPNIRVILHYGPADTGKTHCALHGKFDDPDYYWFDGNNGFWENYKGQKKVILDEFGGHVLSPLQWQRLCDKYPLWLNQKGTSAACAIEEVHICTNYLPGRWWKEGTRYDEKAVYRRIHEVHYHDRYKHYYKFTEQSGPEYPMYYLIKQIATENFVTTTDIIM